MPAEPPSLILLTANHCHLCGHGREVLAALAAEDVLVWREASESSPVGESLASGAPPMRPLLFGEDGRIVAAGRLSARRLRRELDRHASACGVIGDG